MTAEIPSVAAVTCTISPEHSPSAVAMPAFLPCEMLVQEQTNCLGQALK